MRCSPFLLLGVLAQQPPCFPSSAMHGLEWWQVDITGSMIRLMEKLGLASAVKIAKKKQQSEFHEKAGIGRWTKGPMAKKRKVTPIPAPQPKKPFVHGWLKTLRV